MRLMRVAVLLMAACLAWPAVAQPARGRTSAGAGAGPGRMVGPADAGRIADALAERVGLTQAEKAAAKKAVTAKLEARDVLQKEARALAEAAAKPKATDKELSAALKRYDAALATYRQKTKGIDQQLVKALSLKAKAALTAIGVIDNGLGMRFGRRSGFSRGSGAGAFGRAGAGAGQPATRR